MTHCFRRLNYHLETFAAIAVSCLISFVLFACVAPTSNNLTKPNIPENELVAIQLVRDGLAFAASGRLVDAEFKFRQALYIKPAANNVKLNLAVVLERQARFSEARQWYLDLMSEVKQDRLREIEFELALARMDLLNEETLQQGYTSIDSIISELLASNPDAEANVLIARATQLKAASLFAHGFEEEALCCFLLNYEILPQAPSAEALVQLLNSMNLEDHVVKFFMGERGAVLESSTAKTELLVARYLLGELKSKQDFDSELTVRGEGAPLERSVIQELLQEQELADETVEVDGASEDQVSVFADSRLTDPLSFSRQSIKWPAAFEIIVADRVSDNLEASTSEAWWKTWWNSLKSAW